MPDIAVSKKRRVQSSVARSVEPSKIFSPFRAIGNVTNQVPFAIGTLGTTYYIATLVGRSFQIYDAATLHLLFVSQKQTPSDISCLHAHFHHVYAAYDNCISIYKRGQLLHTLVCLVPNVLDSSIKVSKLVQFGSYLVAVSSNNYIFVFKKPADGLSKLPIEFYSHIKVNQNYGSLVDVVHPATYLNKIIVATQSSIFVYNIRSLKMIYKSKCSFAKDTYGTISALEVAPVLDVVAVGTSQSQIVILDFKRDKILKKISFNDNLKQPSSITSLSFRTDGQAHLVAGYKNGDLIFYDLNHNSRIHHLHSIHKAAAGGISNVKFLNGQPIFVTNGADNQLKEFVFDPSLSTLNGATKKTVVPPPRHLRSRGGHSAPPCMITFTDEKDHFIVSGSKDRSFWNFSLRKDSQTQEFSQKVAKNKSLQRTGGLTSSLKEKIPELVCVAYSEARQTDWENIVTGHENEKFARTWSFENKRLGRWKLETPDDGFVKSVCISQCGNFGIVGSSNGSLAIYNLQSGILRKQFKFHKKAVTGIAIDNMNKKMCSVGLDGLIGFYDFNQSKLLGKIDLESPVTLLKFHKPSDLVAVALDDLTIVVLDMVTKRIVRQLVGHRNRITSLDFSPNGRWIVSASLDGTVRTWNLPTGGCIDGFKVDNIVTNLQFSPTGNFLATTHVTGNGISLWNNKSQFKAVSTKHVTEDEFGLVAAASMPNAAGDGGATLLDNAFEDDALHSSDIVENYKSVDQIDLALVTLSLGPRNKFNTLLHLDTIRKRNKPKEAPKKPELAPFFLQTFGEANKEGSDTQVKIDITKIAGDKQQESDTEMQDDDEDEQQAILSRIARDQAVQFENKFTRLLKATERNNSANNEFLTYLTSLSPANLDLEIKSLNVITDSELTELTLFIKTLTFGLESNKNFEIYQAIMNIMLRTHGDIIHSSLASNVELKEALDKWYQANRARTLKMDTLVKHCSGVISFLSSL